MTHLYTNEVRTILHILSVILSILSRGTCFLQVLNASTVDSAISYLLKGRHAFFYECAQVALREAGRKLEEEDDVR